MSVHSRKQVAFRSDRFNTQDAKPYFINPGNFGDDLLRTLASQLSALNCEVSDEPKQEDFGWYLRFSASRVAHCFVIGFRPPDDEHAGLWIGTVERERSLVPSLLGFRNCGVNSVALLAVHSALLSLPGVDGVQWFGREQDGIFVDAAPLPLEG